MSSTYSSNLRIELIGSGDQAGTWGTTTNGSLAYVLDTAIAGYQAVTVSSANQALTYVNGSTSTAALNQAVYAMLKFNSAAAASNIYAPPASKQYILWNNTSYAITIYNSTVIGNTTAAGTGVTLAAGDKIIVWSDGTNFYDVKAQSLTGTLAIANGGTGQTTRQAAMNALAGTQTANRVLRSDGTNTTLAQVNVATDVTGTLAVANGGTGVTTSTGTGNVVLSNSPTLVTPALGTPASGNLANCTFPTLNQNTTGTAAYATNPASGGSFITSSNIGSQSVASATNATNATNVTGVVAIANGGTGVTTLAALGNLFYPVGSIYSSTVSTNPGTLLGFGTWTQFAAGRVLMGAGGSYAAGSTGGSADAIVVSHTHTATFTGNALPAHSHGVDVNANNPGASQRVEHTDAQNVVGTQATSSVSAGTPSGSVSVSTTGSSATDANLQPYIVVYMWQRTA